MSKNSSVKYLKNHPKKAHESYQSLSKEEKEKSNNDHGRYKNLPGR